jgi:hypothetical protein
MVNTSQLYVEQSTGEVGVNDTTPDARFDVDTTAAAGVIFGDGTNNYFTFDGSTDVGDTIFNFNSASSGVTSGSLVSFLADTIDTGVGATFSVDGLTTGTGLFIDDATAAGFSTGKLLSVSSVSTALTSGNLGIFDWSPGSATTATGDLFRLNIGANGSTSGNLFNITDTGSSLFSVNETQITSALPHQFTAAGDVTMAYDLIFTNQTSSLIDSYGPLTVRSGESFESNNLTLKTYNSGDIVIDTAINNGLTYTTAPWLQVTGSTNFGGTALAGSFIDINSAVQEEFNKFRTQQTADTNGTAGAGFGDGGGWGVYENATGTGCIFSSLADTAGGIMRLTADSANQGCLSMIDEAANDARLILDADNLPFMIFKVKPSQADSTSGVYIGMADSTDGVVAAPANFIGFSNDNAGTLGASWVGITRSASTSTTVTCSGATISTTQFAVLAVQVRSATDVHFFYDVNASDGISFTECSTGSATNIPTAALAPQIHWQERTGGTVSTTLDIDYYRAWQDDPISSVADSSTQSSIAQTPITTLDVNGEIHFSEDTNNQGSFKLTDKNGNLIDKLSGLFTLIAENIKAGYIEVNNLVSNKLKVKEILPIDNERDIAITIGDQSTANGQQTGFGKLLIKNAQNQIVAEVDESGNATFSGQLTSNDLQTQDATIAGELHAGTIYADQIISRSSISEDVKVASLSGITREEIEQMLLDAEINQSLVNQSQNWTPSTATGSASLNELALENLYVTGQAAFRGLSLSETLVIGNDLVISSPTTNNLQLTTTVDTVNAPLSIQSSALQPLYIMAGLVQVDTLGNVQIAGDLTVGGSLNAKSLTLSTDAENLTGFGKLLSITDSLGNEVAGITATGSAEFKSINTNVLSVTDDPTATSSATLTGTVYTSEASAGTAKILVGQNEITIVGSKIKTNSLIFITPTSATANTIYVKSQENGKAVIGFDLPAINDVSFNWWIVGVAN